MMESEKFSFGRGSRQKYERRSLQRRYATPFTLLVLGMVAFLLLWEADEQQKVFEDSQRQLAKAAIENTATQLQSHIARHRTQLRLFARTHSDPLRRLAQNPGDDEAYDQVKENLSAYFKSHFAFTLADFDGQPVLEDFDGLIGEVCRIDLQNFAKSASAPLLIIHPNPQEHHFDIMAHWPAPKDSEGILFISFSTRLISQVLDQAQPPGQQFLLTQRHPIPMEITKALSRVMQSNEDPKTVRAQDEILYSRPLHGTQWKLVALPEAGLFSSHWNGILLRHGLIFLIVAAMMLVMLWRVRREEHMRTAISRALQQAQAKLENHVAHRTRELQASHEELHEEKERVQLTLASIGDAVITTDIGGNINYLNPIAEALSGCSSQQVQGKPLTEALTLRREDSEEPIRNPATEGISSGEIVNADTPVLLVRADQSEYTVHYTASPIRNARGHIIGAIIILRDISQERRIAKKLTYQATHDPLTGLSNRQHFQARLETLLDNARSHDQQHALCYLDLDKFKVVNDSCGHMAGDELLRQLAMLLKERLRTSDTLARLGGDEFGVLLEHCDLQVTERVANQLRETVNQFRFSWEDKVFAVGVSIGAVSIHRFSEGAANLMVQADTACYIAKERGRNQIYITRGKNEALERRQNEAPWVNRIHQALEDDRLVLYTQSISPLAVAEPKIREHFEVLVRIRETDDTLVPPGSFIPEAERFNLSHRIDRWVIDNTLRCLSNLYNNAMQQNAFLCHINLCGSTLNHDDLLDYVQNRLQAHQIPAEMICFEIAETAAITHLVNATHFIKELKAHGCSFALDDFGGGVASFGYLKNLPVDYVKIDGGLIERITESQVDMALVKSINEVAHALDVKTVAKQVERDEQRKLLRKAGIDYLQGNLITPPSPLPDHSRPLSNIVEFPKR